MVARMTTATTPNRPQHPKSLACLARRDPIKGETQLRVLVDEYKGHKFLSITVCARTGKGGFAPTQKSVTVRAGEMMEFLAAVQAGEHEMSDAVERANAREMARASGGR